MSKTYNVSNRAQTLVALCIGKPSPTTSDLSLNSSCFTMSPAPSWWDGIFEASDININISASRSCVDLVKRKLSFSPVKGVRTSRGALGNEEAVQVPMLDGPNGSVGNISATKLDTTRVYPVSPSSQVTVCTPNIKTINLNYSENQVSSVPSSDASVSGLKTNSPQVTTHLLQNEDARRNEKKDTGKMHLYPSQRKILAAKLALNSGKKHLTVKGKLKNARSLKPSCGLSCKRCVMPKLTESERHVINSEFWGLGDHVKQWKFIYDSILCTAPRKKSSASGAKGEKLSSRTYHLTVCGRKIRVCKTMFRSTLSICDSWVDSAISHFSNGDIPHDKRGRKPASSIP